MMLFFLVLLFNYYFMYFQLHKMTFDVKQKHSHKLVFREHLIVLIFWQKG